MKRRTRKLSKQEELAKLYATLATAMARAYRHQDVSVADIRRVTAHAASLWSEQTLVLMTVSPEEGTAKVTRT